MGGVRYVTDATVLVLPDLNWGAAGSISVPLLNVLLLNVLVRSVVLGWVAEITLRGRARFG